MNYNLRFSMHYSTVNTWNTNIYSWIFPLTPKYINQRDRQFGTLGGSERTIRPRTCGVSISIEFRLLLKYATVKCSMKVAH
jgi:hypothetical protein